MGDRSYLELGELNQQRIWHMRCQMGSVGVGSSLQDITKAVNSLQPRAVIMVGIAMGANQEKQQIGEVLISRKLVLYEPARVGAIEIIRGDRASASGFLLSRFQSAGVLWQPTPTVNVQAGVILTGEKLVDDPKLREHLLQYEPEAIGIEMEGAGVYSTCVDAGIPWLVVKGICDWGDGNKNHEKVKNQALAAKNAAALTGHVLSVAPPLFKPAEKVLGAVIAHLYWLGSDLADGIRLVQEGQPLVTLQKIVSQAARHFGNPDSDFNRSKMEWRIWRNGLANCRQTNGRATLVCAQQLFRSSRASSRRLTFSSTRKLAPSSTRIAAESCAHSRKPP